MQGTLDLCVAPARCLGHVVRDQAAGRDAGRAARQACYVGGYGWVENLQAGAAGAGGHRSTPPPGEPAPLVGAADDSGFIHAPSLTHAATAALLRNAHLGRERRAAGRRAVRDRPVVAPRARGAAGCSTACGRASRWARCSATASSAACTSCARSRSSSVSPRSRRSSAGKLDATRLPESIAANNVVDGLRAAPRSGDGAKRDVVDASSGCRRDRRRSDRARPRARRARRRDRAVERRAHRRGGLPDGARQHLAHRRRTLEPSRTARRRRPSWRSRACRAAASR